MGNKSKELINNAIKIGDISVLSVKLSGVDSKALRQMVDSLKQQIGSGVVVLATTDNDKVKLIVGVTKNLNDKIKANELLEHIAKQIDGSGGGRADLAQGGGLKVDALQGALDSVTSWIKKKS